MSFRSIVARIRAFFAPAPAPVAPPVAPTLPTWSWVADRTRGGKRTVVASGIIRADSPSSALALLINTGKVFAGEAVNLDGTRYRVWANARPTPIDPAKRGRSGDRKRDREQNG
jgi:hypothetical protein